MAPSSLKLGNTVQKVSELETEVENLRQETIQLALQLDHSETTVEELKSSTQQLKAENSRLQHELNMKGALVLSVNEVIDIKPMLPMSPQLTISVDEVVEIEPILPMPPQLTVSVGGVINIEPILPMSSGLDIGCQAGTATLENSKPRLPLEAENTDFALTLGLCDNDALLSDHKKIAETGKFFLSFMELTYDDTYARLASEKTWPCWVATSNHCSSHPEKRSVKLHIEDGKYSLHIYNTANDVSSHQLSRFFAYTDVMRAKNHNLPLQQSTINLTIHEVGYEKYYGENIWGLCITFEEGQDGEEAHMTWTKALHRALGRNFFQMKYV
ncbi:hypothetical protein FB567DRAFT_598347 [Paraphoma chrysanthemicola]|uniref:Uncharacterized protein n=1 Tax=Paraphoma chrysanthemicola TaxID=798071 RepID=A0A8K0QTS2_9PLEO|nr:hypothetical protein FB567DRAFT_598347 [Paraphoma chrysanthemicola]